MYDDLVICSRAGTIIRMLITAFAGITSIGLFPSLLPMQLLVGKRHQRTGIKINLSFAIRWQLSKGECSRRYLYIVALLH